LGISAIQGRQVFHQVLFESTRSPARANRSAHRHHDEKQDQGEQPGASQSRHRLNVPRQAVDARSQHEVLLRRDHELNPAVGDPAAIGRLGGLVRLHVEVLAGVDRVAVDHDPEHRIVDQPGPIERHLDLSAAVAGQHRGPSNRIVELRNTFDITVDEDLVRPGAAEVGQVQ
jgi:hypothetical protein